MKKLIKIICIGLIILSMSACNAVRNARPITDVHHLDGQRVGVGIAWGADYLLTPRKDLTVVRYNTIASLVQALCYRRVDAMAIESPLVPLILQSVEGLRLIEEPITEDGLVSIFSEGNDELIVEFDEFVANFLQTEDYADLLERTKDSDGFEYIEIEEKGGSKPLKVGIVADNYPFTYYDFETQEYVGIDIEVLRRFANEYDYSIELAPGSWDSMELGVYYGKHDMAISGISELYREDYELTGTLVSKVYLPVDIMFIEVADPDKLKVVSNIEL